MAEGEYYYEEDTQEAEDDSPTWGIMMPHYAYLESSQYYISFGAAGLVNFCFMIILLIGLGHWTVSAAPLIIEYQFKDLRTLPVAITFGVMFLSCILAWASSFMGFGLNYFELPACKTYCKFANQSNFWSLLLIICSIIYWCILPLSKEIIDSTFTVYNWNDWTTREELARLPNQQMCNVAGNDAELAAERSACADRTYDYLKSWTIIMSCIGIVTGLISLVVVAFPGEPRKQKEE